jgi:hypothetical protein
VRHGRSRGGANSSASCDFNTSSTSGLILRGDDGRDDNDFAVAIIVGFLVGACSFAAGTAWLVRHQ